MIPAYNPEAIDFFNRKKRILALAVFLAASLYLAIIYFSDSSKILHAFAGLSFSEWLVLFSCSLASYFVRFIRWQYYLTRLHDPARPDTLPVWPRHFLYYLSGFALTTTPAKAGETVRSLYLLQHNIPLRHSLATFFTERFLDLITIAAISLLILNLTQEYNIFIISALLILFSLIPLLRTHFFLHILDNISSMTPVRFIQWGCRKLQLLLHSARNLFALRPIYLGLLVGMIAWLIPGLAFSFILENVGIHISVLSALAIFAISLLAGALSFVPGGIGTTETVMTLLLSWQGADTSTAIAAALISRLSTLWFAVVTGLLATLLLSLLKPYSATSHEPLQE